MFTVNKMKLRYAIPFQTLAVVLYFLDSYRNGLHEIEHPEVQLAWINFIIYVAIMITLAIVMAPKPQQQKKPVPVGIEQFDVPTAEEGRPIQVLFGKRFIASPNVVWYGHLKSTPIMG